MLILVFFIVHLQTNNKLNRCKYGDCIDVHVFVQCWIIINVNHWTITPFAIVAQIIYFVKVY
jgi:hypothetical protein